MNIQFNHDEETTSKSFNMSEDDMKFIKQAGMFAIINNAIMLETLYDNEDDAPSILRTTSGNLETMLNLIKDDRLSTIALLGFMNLETTLIMMNKLSKIKNGNLLEEMIDNASMLQEYVKSYQDIKNANGVFEKFLHLQTID